MRLLAAEDEAVAVHVLEDRVRAPGLLLWLFLELNPALLELSIGIMDIVAPERAVEEGADPVFVTVGRKEHDARFGSGDGELDPTSAGTHRLVGRDPEVHLLGPEGERPILVRS